MRIVQGRTFFNKSLDIFWDMTTKSAKFARLFHHNLRPVAMPFYIFRGVLIQWIMNMLFGVLKWTRRLGGRFNDRIPSGVQTGYSCILLTFDIIIMKATTKLRNPSKVSSTKEVLQKEFSSRSQSWLLRKLTKYRSSDQEGLRTPQFL